MVWSKSQPNRDFCDEGQITRATDTQKTPDGGRAVGKGTVDCGRWAGQQVRRRVGGTGGGSAFEEVIGVGVEELE